MSRRHRRARRPLYPPIMLRPVPFALPARFLQQLDYDRAVAVARPMPTRLGAPTGWPHPVTRLTTSRDARQPRRFVAVWDESSVGELGWTDGLHTGLGQLNRQVWLGWLHAGRPLGLVAAWLIEHELCLDGAVSPELGPTHCLLVDGDRNCAWAVTYGLGRSIVRMQRFHTRADAEL